jgi:hypothetical protein
MTVTGQVGTGEVEADNFEVGANQPLAEEFEIEVRRGLRTPTPAMVVHVLSRFAATMIALVWCQGTVSEIYRDDDMAYWDARGTTRFDCVDAEV